MNNKNYVKIPIYPHLVERFADNGEHSHWELIDKNTGSIIWTEPEHPLTDTDQNHERKEVDYESDLKYWKQRCLLAEKCLEETPCDPNITNSQIEAWDAYRKFIQSNLRKPQSQSTND